MHSLNEEGEWVPIGTDGYVFNWGTPPVEGSRADVLQALTDAYWQPLREQLLAVQRAFESMFPAVSRAAESIGRNLGPTADEIRKGNRSEINPEEIQ